jgi:hypothetical protein
MNSVEPGGDISGVLILRYLLTEVMTSCRRCRLDRLAEGIEGALRMVQPRPFQPMRKRRHQN